MKFIDGSQSVNKVQVLFANFNQNFVFKVHFVTSDTYV